MEPTYHENYIKKLQRLLHVVIKSQHKLAKASEEIESEEFKHLFHQYSDQRLQIADELRTKIQNLGGQIDESADHGAGVQNWNSTKVNAKKDQSVLDTLRGYEQETLDTYDDVLQGSILEDQDLKTLIMSQRLIINEAYTEMDRRYFEMFKLSQPY